MELLLNGCYGIHYALVNDEDDVPKPQLNYNHSIASKFSDEVKRKSSGIDAEQCHGHEIR